MKRKISRLDEEESRLSSLLFNKSKKFTEQISAPEKNEIDLDLKPAWTDEDDHLRSADIITEIKSDGLYTEKLKQKYQMLIGTPEWAKITSFDNNDDNDKLMRTAGHLIKPKSTTLRKDIIELSRCPKVNSETGNEGPIISAVEFHPKLSVVLVSGQSGVVSLFSISRDVNNKLHSFKLKNWRVNTAHFSPDGSEAYIASKTSHEYCVYNLVKAEPKLVQLPRAIRKPGNFELSPDGKLLATSNSYYEVFIISTKSQELLKTLKHNNKVVSLVFSNCSEKLYCYCTQGEITVWDLSMYRSVNKFLDNGCVTASCISLSSCGLLLATGSGEGIVNIYETQNLTTREPVPLKTISNLTTRISGLTFNPTTEILSVSSSFYPNSMKLVHIPSYSVFSNFPKQNVHLVDTVRFSPNSGFMALGNNKHCANLYRLKHYKNY